VAVCVRLLTLELQIPEASSLKEKRHVLRSLLDGLHHRFNVSAAEIGGHDQWQRSSLAVAVVSNEGAHAEQVVQSALAFVDHEPRVIVHSAETEAL
jgi:uncharacterized protein